jgi:hypothetical protein
LGSSPGKSAATGPRRVVTKGSLAALFYIVVLEYAVGLTIRYVVPGLPGETLDGIYLGGFALAIAGYLAIMRHFPGSKEPAFDKPSAP